MNVRLEQIDSENWYECSQLTVEPDQVRFVSSNLLCIAEVQFHPTWGAHAVCVDDEMVGFVMYEHEVEDDDSDGDAQGEWWISALMIAAGHQGKGFGLAAVRALLSLMRERGCPEIWVGYADDNARARSLYRRLGFVETEVDDEGDMVARLRLEPRG